MNNRYPHRLSAAVLLGLALAGCAPVAPLLGGREPARAHPKADEARARADRTQRAERTSRPPAPRSDDVALREGIALYEDGDYNGAIRRLGGADMHGAALRNRLAALKYMAFSYCVTGRQAQCRQSFDRALRLDPGFDLGAGEHGHPLWGPVFAAARQNARR